MGDKFRATLETDVSSRCLDTPTKETHMTLKAVWFKEHFSDALGRLSDCYASKVLHSGEIGQIGKLTVVISDEVLYRDIKSRI